MKDLFYSQSENIAFYVAGYTDNSVLVKEIISMLDRHVKIFSEKVGVEPDSIKTIFITSSRKYKHMRVFYAENIPTAPEDAFVISAEREWTMHKWLEN